MTDKSGEDGGRDGSGDGLREDGVLEDADVSEELATIRQAGGEELVRWYEQDGPEAAAVPPAPEGAPPVAAVDAEETTREEVRSAVLADVTEHFRTAESDDGFAPLPTEEFVEEQWFDFDYLAEYDEVERKWVNEPYAYVSVLYDDDDKELRYQVTEPALDDFEEFVRSDLTRILRDSLLYRDIEDQNERARLFEREAKSIIAEHAATVDGGSLHKLLYYLTRDFVDFGGIDATMRDEAIEDVSCDGTDVPVFVYHREYRDLKSNLSFSKRGLDSFTVRLAQKAGKSISVSNPLVDASLPDGSRVQLTLGGEISTRGSNFTIRKFADVPYTPVDLIRWNTFGVGEMAYFWLAIENNKSLIFAGGTGSGKTTSLNAVSFFIPPNSKVVSIEDTREITLPHDNWIQSVTRSGITEGGRGEVDMYQLLQSALRQRPEYMLVGEIRTEARVALTFFQAIGTGHTAYTTIHADSIEGVLSRLQNEPLSIPAQMIQNLDIVSIQGQVRMEDRRVRRNHQVVETLESDDPDAVETRAVFERDPRTDSHDRVGESRVLAEIRDERGWDQERLDRELALRTEVLQYLVDNDISDYADVTALVHTFAKDPDYVVEKVRSGELAAPDAGTAVDGQVPETIRSDVEAEGAAGDGPSEEPTTGSADGAGETPPDSESGK